MFMYHLLKSLKLEGLAFGIKPGLNRNIVYLKLIPLPPLAEQKRIVEKVDSLMALCDELEKQQKQKAEKKLSLNRASLSALNSSASRQEFALNWKRVVENFDLLYSTPENVKGLKQTILQLAVMGKLVKQNPSDQPASELLEEIKAEKERLIGEGNPSTGLRARIKNGSRGGAEGAEIKPEEVPYELPKGWVWCFSEDLFEYEQGIQVDKNLQRTNKIEGYVRFLRIVDYTQNTDDIRYVKHPGKKYEVNKESLVMVRYGASAGFISGGLEGVLANNLFKIHYGLLNKKYVKRLFQSSYFMKELSFNTKGGAMPAINFGFLNTFKFPLPPLPEQKRIVEKVDALMILCDELERGLVDSTAKQGSLLDAVLAGV